MLRLTSTVYKKMVVNKDLPFNHYAFEGISDVLGDEFRQLASFAWLVKAII